MLVGNDIVDLGDRGSQSDAIHPRFDERVFTVAERARLTASRSPHRLRWSLWAAKESAFKVARKMDAAVRFRPMAFAVRSIGDGRAEVEHGTRRFSVWFEHANEWLHATALHAHDSLIGRGRQGRRSDGRESIGSRPVRVPPDVGTRVGHLPGEVRGQGSSALVRRVARASIGEVIEVAPAELEIVTEGGIPTLRLRDATPLPVDLSLSHHGRFVACAWALGGS